MLSISFIFLEIVLRVFDPLGVEYFSEVVRYFKVLEMKENYSYIHPANMCGKFQGIEIKTNSLGLRWNEFDKTKKRGKKRVLILGDSVVLGWGVEHDMTFPALIQNMSDSSKADVEIIPAGVSSWNTRTEYEYLRRVALGFDPDILILMIVSNDTDPKENSNIEIGAEELKKLIYKTNEDQDLFRKTWFKLVDLSYVFRHLQYAVKLITEKDTNVGASRNDLTWKDTEKALNGMIEICKTDSIEFLPFIYADEKKSAGHPIYSLYREHFNDNNIMYHTFPEILFKNNKYQNSVIDNHPNAGGHKIIAEEIYRLIKDELKL